jgi:uncharacterized protein (TIGR00299 family) protein
MRFGFLDCFSGASGDMLIGSLLDAGLDFDALCQELAKLGLGEVDRDREYALTYVQEVRHGLKGTKFHVSVQQGASEDRHLADITQLVQESTLSPEVIDRSISVFRRLAVAEAAVHGTSIERVHFHEVGAVDSIIDIVGFIIGLDLLRIDVLYCSPLTLGSGTVRSEHGVLPAPAPATLEILMAAGVPTRRHPQARTELLTPTAAALLCELARFDLGAADRPPPVSVCAVGYGFGTREFDWANAVRIWLAEVEASGQNAQDEVLLLECNLDDCTGETLGYALEQCLAAGALDAWLTPIQMKKGRPGVKFSVLTTPDFLESVCELLLRETTTLGVRYSSHRRRKAERRIRAAQTPWGEVRLKDKILGGQVVASSPEYEDCARLARQTGVPLIDVLRAAAGQ